MLVSIAMATFNGEKYLSQQLDSIIQQTYRPIEVVIVDDESSDRTIEIIQSYIERYSFISLHQNPQNIGVVATFNQAISLCKGEFVALSDQDDVWFDNKVEVLVSNIGDNWLIHSDALITDSNLQVIANSHFKFSNKPNNLEFSDYLISNNVTGCCAMFSRKLLDLAMPIPQGFYIHDHYFAIMAAFYNKITFYANDLIYYRQHDNSTIGAIRPDFDRLVNNCKQKALSYQILLDKVELRDNQELSFFQKYMQSIYQKKWIGFFNLLHLFSYKQWLKLFGAYILLSRLFGDRLPRFVFGIRYSFIRFK